MPILKILSCLLFVLAFSFSSCKKKEIQGPTGEAGVNGTGGNSSTSSSAIFMVATTQWTTTADSSAWVFTIESNLITKKVAETGSVKLFVQRNSLWWELPFAEGDLITQVGFSEGKAKMVFADIHGGLPAKPITGSYRLVALFENN